MNLPELRAALLEYAKEDLQIAKEEGEVAITDTTKGLIFLRCEDNKYTVSNKLEIIEKDLDHESMIPKLMDLYSIELAKE